MCSPCSTNIHMKVEGREEGKYREGRKREVGKEENREGESWRCRELWGGGKILKTVLSLADE